jgi:F420H(2)-dependent biliverdin reductase
MPNHCQSVYVSFDVDALPAGAISFLSERHLATLTVTRPDGTAHVSPVGFSYDVATATARVITSAGARKSMYAAASGRAVLCQVDGGVWLTLEGAARVSNDPDEVADAEARYTERYQAPRVNPTRVVIVIQVDKVFGRIREE